MIRNLSGTDLCCIDSVFLDLDGTVSESGLSSMNGVKYMFDKIGFRQISNEELRAFVGPTVRVHLEQEYGFSKEEALAAYEYYREYYDGIGIFESTMYDGIEEAIVSIKDSGKKVYLATLKPENQAKQIVERYGISGLFDGIFGARHDLDILHKQQVLERAIELIKEHPGKSVMVGDRKHDINAAKHVGFSSVGVLYGYGTYDELESAGCDIIVDSVQDLKQLLGRKD